MAADLGTGTTITFATSGFTAEVTDISGSGNYAREAIQTSYMGTTDAHTFVPGDLYDGGEFSVDIHFLGSSAPEVTGAEETITIDWGGAGDTWAFSGFITGFEPSASLEEKMTATVNIKVTGTITGSPS